MAEAALKYDEFEDFDDIEPVQIPAGGIATFLTAREGMFADDDDDELPSGGIASVKQVADKLAEYGRHEDEFMVHAAEGETVIPMEVFRKNPILKENIYRQMRDMGLEPERYVVGNELNSINPVTGQPEFFIKKLFKKLGRFLKKAIKVILPIALNFIPGVGPIMAAALGSGIGGLIQGESFGDALKSAAIGGLTAGVAKGIGGGIGAVKEGGKFGTGFKAGLKAGEMGDVVAAGRQAARAQNLAAAGGPSIDVGAALGTGKPAALAANKLELLSTELTKRGVDGNTIQQIVNDGFSKGLTVDQILVGQGIKYDPAVFIAGQGMTGTAAEQVAAREAVLQSGTPRPGGSGIALEKIDGIDVAGTQLPGAPTITEEGGFIVETYPDGRKVRTLKGYDPKPLGEAVGTATEAATTTTRAAPLDIQVEKFLETGQVKTPGVMDSLRKLGPGGDDFGEGLRDLFMPGRGQRAAAENLLVQQFGEGVRNLPKFSQYVDTLTREGPNFLRRMLPGTIAAMGIGNLVSPPENPEAIDMSGEGISKALSLLEENPEQYRSFQNLQIRGGGQFSPFEIQPLYSEPLGTTTYQSVADVATGGGMDVNDFPPRIGAISGPGTETSDDIPAMLSDGEFVMTAEAVRGAGNGSREAGMRNMYQMMNQFEAMA
jgi:hypothetical protein